jgi:effector-binding domain-containing protein
MEPQMIKHLILAVFIGLVSFVIYLYVYLGAYKSPTLVLENRPGLNLLYKAHFGAYHKINSVITEVETWAKANQLDCSLSFGEYLDHPHQVEEGRLRSRGGCVLKTDLQVPALPEGFELASYPERLYVVATFEGAPSIGPYKVYNKVETYMVQNLLRPAGPVIEIYENAVQGFVTTYLFPVKK